MPDFNTTDIAFVDTHMASMKKDQILNAISSAVVIRLKYAVLVGETQYFLPDVQVD